MDERTLIRRVATASCAVAVATLPLVRSSVSNDGSWLVSTALVVALGLALVGLGYRRVPLRTVVGTTALCLWAVTVVSFWQSTTALVGGGPVVAYGSGPLWLAAVLGPLVLLAFPIRHAMMFAVAAGAAYPLVWLIGAGPAAGRLLWSSGLWFQVAATVIVLQVTWVVAHLANRSAVEQLEAEALRRRAAAEQHDLVSAQRHRRIVFSRAATELRKPMAELSTAVEALGTTAPAELRDVAGRVATLSADLLDDIGASLRGLVLSTSTVPGPDPVVHDEPAPAGAAAGHRHGLSSIAVPVAVVIAVIIDALWSASRLADGAPGAVLLAMSGSRMLLVVFVGAALIVLRRPGPFGWAAILTSLLVHPVVLLGATVGSTSPSLLSALLPSWRITMLSVTFVLLLSVVIERRAGARDIANREAAAHVASSGELRLQEIEAGQTYAEATHELKNPLTVICGGAQTLRDGRPLSELRTTQLRDAVVRSTARLDERLRAMRVVAGLPDEIRPDETPATINIRPVLEATTAALDVAGQKAAIELDLRCDDALVEIVDNHLDHVMENLLGNAFEYGQPGGPVRVEARIDGDHVRVEVANRGGSLTPGNATHVFEPYWRASDGPQHPRGSGLGLAIVSRLVEGWNGTRWCTVADGWTRLGFTIPMAGSTGPAVMQDRDQAPGRTDSKRNPAA